MNKFMLFAGASLISVAVATSTVSPAYAWHPKGQIVKSVQNMTTGGDAKDANTAATAVAAKPGDILQYTVEIRNIAAPADKQWNDLAHGNLTDSLPAGVELVGDPTVREIKATFPTVLPGKSFTKQYQVKVTSTTDGKVIENKACYKADSVVKDNPQSGCDVANVKVTVPVAPVTPTPVTSAPVTPGVGGAVTPAPVVTPAAAVVAAPAELPNVGIGALAPVAALLTSVLGYFGYASMLKRRVMA